MGRLAIHPGETLAEILEEYQVEPERAAGYLHVPAVEIVEILDGTRSITPEMALRLGQWLGMSGQFWLNLQRLYELRLAEQSVGEKITQTVIPRDGLPSEAA